MAPENVVVDGYLVICTRGRSRHPDGSKLLAKRLSLETCDLQASPWLFVRVFHEDDLPHSSGCLTPEKADTKALG